MAGLGKIAIFDPTITTQQGEIDLTSLGVSDSNPDPSAMLLRDGLLFVGLSQMVGGWIPHRIARTATLPSLTPKRISC